MSLHYRNKTIFDWNGYNENKISSIISLSLMNFLKANIIDVNIKNVIVRDINDKIGIIIQLDDIKYEYIFNKINSFIIDSGFKLEYFAFQLPYKKSFVKDKNIIVKKSNFIKFNLDYISDVKISLLPNSFFQPNISILNIYYENFVKWIEDSQSTYMINLGDDGGNVCTLLNKKFDQMISLFHCNQSYLCANEMIKDNKIKNLQLTFDINDCILFSKRFENILLFINPGRKGLKDWEIDFINKSDNIKSIIYMACNYKAFLKDSSKLNKLNEVDRVQIEAMPLTGMMQNLIYLKV